MLAHASHVQGGPDSVRVRFEVGAGVDVTNELYYEDAFVDTTFLGRRRIGIPESRWSTLALAVVEGARSGGLVRFRVQNEASIGDRLQRNAAWARWDRAVGPNWTVALTPRVEFRRDRTFGRDLTQWRGEAAAKARREFDDGTTAGEVGLRGDVLTTDGSGASYVPDRRSGRATVTFEGLPLLGPEWQLGYGLTHRQFPDSTTRDHLEHGVEGRLRVASWRGHALTLDGDGVRRSTLRGAPTTRDDFMQGRARAEVQARLAEAWLVSVDFEVESMRYDRQDSVLYFDYGVSRAGITPRFERLRWSLRAGPRVERLTSRLAPAEGYWEYAGLAGLELLGGGAWWSFTPAAGTRRYDAPAASDPLGLHSSYTFADGTLHAEQSLPAALRLRLAAMVRQEWHADPAQDARSLYLSFELRRLF